MDVSVIMATYKESEELLKQAIESILRQTYKEFEFIIVLDNPDNLEHIRIIQAYQQIDDRIVFCINEKNIGLTRSLNRALSLAKGKYICRMDADDVSVPNRIMLQKSYIEKECVDIIGGLTEVINEDGKALYSIKKVPSNPDKIRKGLRYNQVIAHPTWFGKKQIFDDLDGYRQIPLCEDYDFTLRAALKGYKISNLNEIVLKYRMTELSISRSNLFQQYLYARYITGQYKKGRMTDIEQAKLYVERKCDKKASEKYLKANVRFNTLLKDMEQKNIIRFLWDGTMLFFTSPYYLDKIYRFARAAFYS